MAPRTPVLDPSGARQEMLDLARAYGEGTLGHPSRFFPEPAEPTVQLRSAGDGPHGTQTVSSNGASLTCPAVVAHSEVAHLTMPTNGTAKTLKLSDGTQITISAQR